MTTTYRFYSSTVPPWLPGALCAASVLLGVLMTGCAPSAEDTLSGSGSGEAGSGVAELEFPQGDPAVPAEEGGPGFSGEGWETATPGPLGDPRALKGGVITSNMPNWPENLRMYGTGSNTWLNYLVRDLCYMSLCRIDPVTLEVLPGLATHWQILDDNMTFRFRLNPRAHWSDGKPVVAEDWVATYRLINDDTLIDPMSKETLCTKMEEPKVLSKYMLEVKCRQRDWRNFLTMSGIPVMPAHEISGLTGKDFLDKYNFAYPAFSGPYEVLPSDIRKGDSLTLTRRKDWWAAEDESNIGLYNFDKIRFLVVLDRRKGFEMACKGQIDFYPVYTAEWWVKDVTPLAAYKRGQLIRREIFTKFPKGIQGLAFNMREPPLDDVRVRKAVAHLYDRRTMLTKFAFDQYLPTKSYYPGSDAENPDNEVIEYNVDRAITLLEEAGWTERDTDGVRMQNGERLVLNIQYRSQAFEKYLTNLQESCKRAGIEIQLTLTNPETHWKNMMERSFQVAGMAWGQVLYPGPRTTWHSSMADESGSNNITGVKDEQIDALIDQYDAEFDLPRRTEILREIDGLLHELVPYALEWYNPAERVLYWNKFGMPEYGLHRYAEFEEAFSLWWYDPAKAKRLKETLQQETEMEPIPELEIRYWDEADGN